jgi:hypothetical protein
VASTNTMEVTSDSLLKRTAGVEDHRPASRVKHRQRPMSGRTARTPNAARPRPAGAVRAIGARTLAMRRLLARADRESESEAAMRIRACPQALWSNKGELRR